jgi:glycosyltransferase 2 family protein
VDAILSKRRRWSRLAPWIFGLLALATLIVVVVNIGELERFLRLLGSVEPRWLILAALSQLLTYLCAAFVWHRTLALAGSRIPFRSLVPLNLAKLFTDQAVPSVGLSGTMLLARGLTRHGVSAELATQVLLVTVVSFYAAYLVAALAAVGLLWLHHEAGFWIVSVAAVFTLVAVAIPAAALSLKRWGIRVPAAWVEKLPGVAATFERVAAAPMDLLTRKALLAQAFVLQACVFLLDAATLWIAFRALGQPVSFASVFIAFMIASVVATLGPVPGGLGTFEASSVGMLSVLGVDVETALAATLLLRGFSFWLPMIPGLFFARRELAAAPS